MVRNTHRVPRPIDGQRARHSCSNSNSCEIYFINASLKLTEVMRPVGALFLITPFIILGDYGDVYRRVYQHVVGAKENHECKLHWHDELLDVYAF